MSSPSDTVRQEEPLAGDHPETTSGAGKWVVGIILLGGGIILGVADQPGSGTRPVRYSTVDSEQASEKWAGQRFTGLLQDQKDRFAGLYARDPYSGRFCVLRPAGGALASLPTSSDGCFTPYFFMKLASLPWAPVGQPSTPYSSRVRLQKVNGRPLALVPIGIRDRRAGRFQLGWVVAICEAWALWRKGLGLPRQARDLVILVNKGSYQ